MGVGTEIAMCVPALASRMRRHKIFKIFVGISDNYIF